MQSDSKWWCLDVAYLVFFLLDSQGKASACFSGIRTGYFQDWTRDGVPLSQVLSVSVENMYIYLTFTVLQFLP